ncbi:hypothetical protein FPHOBKDP_00074 [Listeria phage LPJP1]|nr:hypothetical protein FPHOBKDP_00074 [Listeria phage LPJP1]
MHKKKKLNRMNIKTTCVSIIVILLLSLTAFQTIHQSNLNHMIQSQEKLILKQNKINNNLEEQNENIVNKSNKMSTDIKELTKKIKDKDTIIKNIKNDNIKLIKKLKLNKGHKVKNKKTVRNVSTKENSSYRKIGSFRMTVYAVGDDYTPSTGITANGTKVSNTIYSPEGHRIVAVDTSVIPMNSILRITYPNGNSFIAKACDTGSAIIGNKIDLLIDKSQIGSSGTSNVTVSILK